MGVLAVLLMGSGMFMSHRPPQSHIIPADYEGWVVIVFEQEHGAPLIKREGSVQYRIPSTGILLTQGPSSAGWGEAPVYQDPQGNVISVYRPRLGVRGRCQYTFYSYWVGPEEKVKWPTMKDDHMDEVDALACGQ